MIGHRPADWTADAACVGMTGRDYDPWTPDLEEVTPEEAAFQWHLARKVCHRCPVRLDCAVDALKRLPLNEEHAMRGGLTPDELIDLAKGMGLKWRREAQHGTRSRYVAGCTADPEGRACQDCKDAHAVYEHDRRLWAKTRKARQITRTDVYAHLTRPIGRGKRAVGPGQLVLFTDGLRPSLYAQEAAA